MKVLVIGQPCNRDHDEKKAILYTRFQIGNFTPEISHGDDLPIGFEGLVYVGEGVGFTQNMYQRAIDSGMDAEFLEQYKSALVRVNNNRVGVLRAIIL